MDKLSLYNTYGRGLTEIPREKQKVSVYACGPTVYDYAHIGNLRNYLFVDTLHRALLLAKKDVDLVINITDVGHLTDDADQGEDKLEKRSREKGKDARELAAFYEKAFKKDIASLNIKQPDKWPRATEHIKEQIKLIQDIEENGYTYETPDGIYFDTGKLEDYGELIHNFSPDQLKPGHRVDMKDKKNPTDFALWKFSGEETRQMEWESPWGKGFPGWHIECTAMGCKYLGKTFDIHTGGVDHIPVHHTNELAQARGANKEPHAEIWMHGEFLNLKDGKMSKSKRDFIRLQTIRDKGYSPLDFRYLCLLTKYRKPLEFSWEALSAARTARLSLLKQVPSVEAQQKEYLPIKKALLNDLNTPKALGELRKAMKKDLGAKEKKAIVKYADKALGLQLSEGLRVPQHVKELAEKRDELRSQKKYEEADALRRKIEREGYVVEDGEETTLLPSLEQTG